MRLPSAPRLAGDSDELKTRDTGRWSYQIMGSVSV